LRYTCLESSRHHNREEHFNCLRVGSRDWRSIRHIVYARLPINSLYFNGYRVTCKWVPVRGVGSCGRI